jgi:hypothetical protein
MPEEGDEDAEAASALLKAASNGNETQVKACLFVCVCVAVLKAASNGNEAQVKACVCVCVCVGTYWHC